MDLRAIALLIFLLIIKLCCGYKILAVFPVPGVSHSILGHGLVKTLLEANHEVTYITSMLLENPPKNLHQIDVSSNFDILPTEQIFNIEKMMKKEVDLFDVSVLFDIMGKVSNHTVMNDNVQRVLRNPKENYDVVIVEWMYNEIYSGFSSVFNCPFIWSSSMEPHFLILSLMDEDPNPAYTADIFTSDSPPFTFMQRVSRLAAYIDTRVKKWLYHDVDNAIYEAVFGPAVTARGQKLLPLEEVKYNAALMLGNSHVSLGQSFRMPVNYIPIAGYHIDPHVKPLPRDLQKIMDDSEHGVIYFSMGSLLKSRHIPDKIKKEILTVFSQLKQIVIWKFEENMQDVPKNVHIVHWAPQQSILAHPKCVLFITHGGLLSQIETLHFGVPIIGIPMFADQFVNVNRAVIKGFGIKVDLDYETPVKLKMAIQDVLGNPGYRKKVKQLSLAYHDRVASPRAALLHGVEHVVRTGGAPHLRSPALALNYYQKWYLDLAAVCFMSIIVLILILTIVFCRKNCNSSKSKRD